MTTLLDRFVGQRRATPAPDAPEEPAAPTGTRRVAVGKLHRTVTVLAVLSLFVGTRDDWASTIWNSRDAAFTIMAGYGLMFLLGIAALAVRGRRVMTGVDIGVLVVSCLIRLPVFFASWAPGAPTYSNDEGALVDHAGQALAAGLNPYVVPWAEAYVPRTPGVTGTMSGGVVDHFDYPPLTALLDFLFRPVSGGAPTAAFVAIIALVAAAVMVFVTVPAPWRATGPMICLGFDILPAFARNGYPSVVSLPFVIGAVAAWARIGVDRRTGVPHGRLGARGWFSAVCLGLAISTQPLPWFMAPFLVVGVFLVRAGDLSTGRAAALAGRYAGVALGVALAVNVPFIVADAGAWSSAILTPMLTPTVPHGQGLMGLTYYLTGGSAQLQFYGYATFALLVGVLGLFALFPRRLGLAMVVLPWTIFYLSIRSQDIYFLLMAPLWIVSIATMSQADFARARQWRPRVRGRSPLSARPVQVAVGAVLLLPAAWCTQVALASPQPLRMRVVAVEVSKTKFLTNVVEVEVTNVSDRPIAPHFALSDNQSMSRFWYNDTGPDVLAPGETELYVLVPPWPGSRRSLDGRVVLRAVSDSPTTLSSVPLNDVDQPDQSGTGGGVPRWTF